MQEYITAFQYNHTPSTYFDQNKQRPLCRILSTARDIVRQGLPIKCVEAVFLALLLTAGWKDLDRIPVGFKTCIAGHVYRSGLPYYQAWQHLQSRLHTFGHMCWPYLQNRYVCCAAK